MWNYGNGDSVQFHRGLGRSLTHGHKEILESSVGGREETSVWSRENFSQLPHLLLKYGKICQIRIYTVNSDNGKEGMICISQLQKN